MYDCKNPSQFSEDDCQDAVGKNATLILTGRVIDYGVSTSGAYVKFQPDERFGFNASIVIDLDALEVA